MGTLRTRAPVATKMALLSAGAIVAGHGRDDLLVGGVRCLGEERGRLHDLAPLAVAAPWHLLDRVGLAVDQ
jgi:hypothetical protein